MSVWERPRSVKTTFSRDDAWSRRQSVVRALLAFHAFHTSLARFYAKRAKHAKRLVGPCLAPFHDAPRAPLVYPSERRERITASHACTMHARSAPVPARVRVASASRVARREGARATRTCVSAGAAAFPLLAAGCSVSNCSAGKAATARHMRLCVCSACPIKEATILLVNSTVLPR